MADDPTKSVPTNTPADPTPYIRTYAKDVARLTGTQAAVVHSPFKKDAPEPGVLLADVDESPRQGTEPASPKEFPQEVLEVTKNDTVANLNTPKEAPQGWGSASTMPHVPVTSAPQVASREDKRDEILSRLRAKVQPEPAVAQPAPAPFVPAPPPPEPLAQAFPATRPPEVQLPASTAPSQAFPFRQQPQPAPIASDLHTFKSDFADHIDSQNASKFSVLAAQGDSKDTRAPQPAVLKPKQQNRWPLIAGATLLILLGVGGLGGAAYWFITKTAGAPTPFEVPSLIFADEKVEVTGTGPALATAIAQVAHQTSVNGNVIVTYETSATSSKSGIIKTPVASGILIRDLFDAAPDILTRNIDDTSTMGVVDGGDTTAPFFILRVSSYERTFAGMLGWEATIATDLATLYPASPSAAAAANGSSTPLIGNGRFIDEVVSNHDVRAIKDPAGNTVLLYGYRDKQTMIIAHDEAAFTILLDRLNAATGS